MSLLNHFVKVEKQDYDSRMKTELEKMNDEMNIESAVVVEKRQPGRPKKRLELDASSLSSCTTPRIFSASSAEESDDSFTPATKRSRVDWFASPLIHDIVEEVRMCKSARLAVERLKRKFPKLPTEEKGRFEDLKENTVRYWFEDDWTLKEQFAALVKHKKGGRRQFFTAEIERKVIDHLTKLREKGQTMPHSDENRVDCGARGED